MSATILLGLDIGGTKSAAIVGDAEGTVLARRAAPTPPGDWRDAVALQISLLRGVCADAGIAVSDARALGVSCGGPLDSSSGIVYAPPNLPGWPEVPLRDVLEKEFGIDVLLENDANATALAEWRWGAGIGCENFAFLTMGTGIGAGLILDGKLYRGRRDLAGEIGHWTMIPDGPPCPCGKRGCLEALASGTAIGRRGRETFGEPGMTAETVCARARAGDETARAILSEAARWMGIALANLLHVLNLERIVLGTLAVHAADLLMEPICQTVREHCWPRVWDGVSIVPAALGDAAQDKAALAVALQNSISPP